MADVVEFNKQEEAPDPTVESIQIASEILVTTKRPYLILVSGTEGQMYCNTNLRGIFASALMVQMTSKILVDVLNQLTQGSEEDVINAPAPK